MSENFTDHEQKITEKLKLFKDTSKLIYCRDYPQIPTRPSWHQEVSLEQVSTFTWSKKSRADLQIGRIHRQEHETEVQGIYKNEFIGIRIPFTDDA